MIFGVKIIFRDRPWAPQSFWVRKSDILENWFFNFIIFLVICNDRKKGLNVLKHESPIHGAHFKKKIRSLASRSQILWPLEKFWSEKLEMCKIARARESQFRRKRQIFPESYKIGPLGARDPILFLKWG